MAADFLPSGGRVLWEVHQFGRTIYAVALPHPDGEAFAVLMGPEAGGDFALQWTHLVRPGDAHTIEAESETIRQAFLAGGWTL